MDYMNIPIDFPIYDTLSERNIMFSKKIYAYLKTRVGKRKAKTCEAILIKTRLYFKLNDAEFRMIIHYLRLNVDARICACGVGYYMAENEEEMKDFLDRLQKRVQTQMVTIYHIENGVLNWNK